MTVERREVEMIKLRDSGVNHTDVGLSSADYNNTTRSCVKLL